MESEAPTDRCEECGQRCPDDLTAMSGYGPVLCSFCAADEQRRQDWKDEQYRLDPEAPPQGGLWSAVYDAKLDEDYENGAAVDW